MNALHSFDEGADGMNHDDQMTLGEVGRAVKRLETAVENLSSKMTVALGPVGELRVHVENAKQDINELWAALRAETEARIADAKAHASRIGNLELRAATVAGIVTGVGFFIKFLLGK